MIAAVGSALVVSPHAMWYEPGVLAPAVVALLLKRDWRAGPGGLFLLMLGSAWSLAILLATPAGPFARRRGSAAEPTGIRTPLNGSLLSW